MRVDELRRAHAARPFRPFALELADGQRVRVPHPEFMAVAPAGNMAYVWDAKSLPIWIDPPNVTAIDFRPTKAKARRGGRKRQAGRRRKASASAAGQSSPTGGGLRNIRGMPRSLTRSATGTRLRP